MPLDSSLTAEPAEPLAAIYFDGPEDAGKALRDQYAALLDQAARAEAVIS